jgi:catechol 2,3-dioxygenase-like lactoylglutathione lyase family enzyme
MGVRADHHVSLRVADLERSIAFYEQALGGRLVSPPFEHSGPFIEEVFRRPGVRVRVCHVAFDANAVELWQFLEPALPVPPADQFALGQMHFGVTVDDVTVTLAAIEAAGGCARFPVKQVGGEGGFHFVYCEDPDGHVFELIDRDHPGTLEVLHRRRGAAGSPS